MKLLFDQNLSLKLVPRLLDLFPGSIHVREVGLESADDEVVWNYARDHAFTIVSKDADFHQRSFLYGFPPKVLWVVSGNCSTEGIERVIRANNLRIVHFIRDNKAAFLVLGEKGKKPF